MAGGEPQRPSTGNRRRHRISRARKDSHAGSPLVEIAIQLVTLTERVDTWSRSQRQRVARPSGEGRSGVNTHEPRRLVTAVAGADPALDQQLSDHLSEFNQAATPDVAPARELTVQVRDNTGDLVGGISGWTWGDAGGMSMVWVHPDVRGTGVGSRLLADFETEAASRGCTHVFVTSFTFQAPGFYERHGYSQIFRWEGVPMPEHADVHFRKDLS